MLVAFYCVTVSHKSHNLSLIVTQQRIFTIFRLQSFYKKYNVDTMGLRKFVVLVGGGSYNPLTRYDDEMMMLISANSVE